MDFWNHGSTNKTRSWLSKYVKSNQNMIGIQCVINDRIHPWFTDLGHNSAGIILNKRSKSKKVQVCKFCTCTKHLFLNHMGRTHKINIVHGDSNFTFREWFYAKHQSFGLIVRLHDLCQLASQWLLRLRAKFLLKIHDDSLRLDVGPILVLCILDVCKSIWNWMNGDEWAFQLTFRQLPCGTYGPADGKNGLCD